mgnify:CR=1 FL=1
MLGQRVGAQQQVLYVLEVATGFRQAIYRGSRADFVFSGFRAELFQHWRQWVIPATAGQTASTTGRFPFQLTAPVLGPLRNLLPSLGGLDVSPIVVIIGIYFIRDVIIPNLIRAVA